MGSHPARPVLPGRPGVVRVRGLAYGDGPRRTLDVYHRRDQPASAPILLHFHGGGFYSGNKAREARPLIRHLTSRRGFVCVSADYRLQPHVTLADQVADVRDAIAWVRAHAAEYGAEPGTLFVAGSSAGANLAIRAVCEGETGIAGLICRYGYYGDLAPRGDMPPMLVVHGEKDMWIPVSDVRAFVERVRAVSSRPVIYAELPGAHHDFDMFESIRSAAVSQAVEQFTARVSASPATRTGSPRKIRDHPAFRRRCRSCSSAGERRTLNKRVRGAKTAHRDRLRAQIVLAAARGHPNARITAGLGISVDTVRKWRGRFAARGLDGLQRPGPAPAGLAADQRGGPDRGGRAGLPVGPPPPVTPPAHWTGPELAAELTARELASSPVSASSVLRILAEHPVKP